MRRTLTSWLVVFALLAAGFGATVLALNNDVFSAHGFVRSYLQALARQNSAEALAFAGVEVPEGASTTLLTDAALGEVRDIRFIGEVTDRAVTTVRFEYRLSMGKLSTEKQQTEFQVERDGSHLGLFHGWRFAESPMAVLAVTVDNDSRFSANGVDSLTGAPEAVLVPGGYLLDSDTEFLTAVQAEVSAVETGGTVDARLEVTPTPAFADAAETAIATFLDACATQEVLMPTGCPFGFVEANRVVGIPKWSMSDYPRATLAAGEQPGTWVATGEGGEVALQLTVKSLFDGSTSEVEQSVPIRGSYTLTLGTDNSVTVLEGRS